MEDQQQSPIFIHSLFRSGSTYLFKVFRRSDAGYWCYQEPLNERLLQRASTADGFTESREGMREMLRHPSLDRPYFHEYHDLKDVILQRYKEKFAYEQYFISAQDDLSELKAYLDALLHGAQGIPVLQFCRSLGRLDALKSLYDARHVFLWRNPWDQWWSYRQAPYFDSRNLFILYAANAPEYLLALKRELRLPELGHAPPEARQGFCNSRVLGAEVNYRLFYAIWCHAMLEGQQHCDASIDIDRLSLSPDYQQECTSALQQLGVTGLDFSDCDSPMATYGEADRDFFAAQETYVHQLLSAHGIPAAQVEELEVLARQRQQSTVDTQEAANSAVRDAMRARAYYRSVLGGLSETQEKLFATQGRLLQLESQQKQAGNQ